MPLAVLSRTDKYSLGSGGRLIWAPTFPQWLGFPGLWDKANFYDLEIAPVFTYTLLDERLRPLPLQLTGTHWQPGHAENIFTFGETLTLVEKRAVLPQDVIGVDCEVRFRGDKECGMHLVAWTAQQDRPDGVETSTPQAALAAEKGATRCLLLYKAISRFGRPAYPFFMAFGLSEAGAQCVLQSQATAVHPHWRYTPFVEHLTADGLPDAFPGDEAEPGGIFYLGLHRKFHLSPGQTVRFQIVAAFDENAGQARASLLASLSQPDLTAPADRAVQEFYDTMPRFTGDDPYLQKYYPYRLYGLHLHRTPGGNPNMPFPAICEGIDYFHVPITYSAFCHMREMRWAHDPVVAQGSLRNFIHRQLDSGRFAGHLYAGSVGAEDFYHADWGGSLLALHAVHPDKDFLRAVYAGLSRYCAYFERERDPEDSGLYDIVNHYETGQEYMDRYLVANPHADRKSWGNNFRLKGVEVAVYMYRLFQALAAIAEAAGHADDGPIWQAKAAKTGSAILQYMWDPEEEMFFDLVSATKTRTGVKAAVCFYPYWTDLVDVTHLPGLKKHLFDPDTFWTPYPVPASALDNPHFSATPEWKGKRHNCPWNGRVWPMTNSHIADIIGTCARRFDDAELRQRFVEFFGKYIRMLFFGGDVERPNCFEHYNPFTGNPSEYRGVDDYQHSWIVDLYLSYVAGIDLSTPGVLRIDVFPFPMQQMRADNIVLRGKPLTVERKGAMVRARFGDVEQGRQIGQAMVFSL